MANQKTMPKGWRSVRLGNVANVSFSTVDKKTIESEVPIELCNYTDVFYNRRIQMGMPFMPATASPAECEKWVLRQGDVIFTKDSETQDEIGIPSYVVADMPNVLCGYHLGLARPCTSTIDGAFLARTLASPTSVREFSRIANGVTRFGLTLDATRNIPLLLPPLPEQRAIAAVLDSIDDAIERTEEIIIATEQLRGSLLHQLLSRGVPARHTEWKDVPVLGTIPAEWDVVRLGAVAEVAFSSVDKKTTEGEFSVRLCNYTDVFYNRRIRSDINLMEATANPLEIERWNLRRGDVLFTKDSETRHEIGIPAFVEVDMPKVLCGYHLGLARPHPHVLDGAYLAEAFSSLKLAVQFTRIANGVTRFGLTLGATGQLAIPLPSLSEQKAIAGLLDSVDATLTQVRQERAVLQSLKDSTADALLTGQKRISA